MEDIHNQSIIYKGKRTKRLRPLSPISYALPATSSTEEEEDMANCLILLAQGHFSNPLPRQVEDHGYKYSSRRYMPAADNAGAGKAGYYVYQCKTCDRTFSSFQALGGHRASHKKPKGAAGEEHHHKRQRHLHEEEGQFMGMGSSLSLQLTNNNNTNNKVGNGNKVHECSICGAEFTSGQALGGHMRRHRGTISATALTLTTADYSGSGDQQQPIGIGINNNNKKAVSLDLDLNLPAPPDDQQQQPNFIFPASDQHQQKPPLLLSASALVDCHY